MARALRGLTIGRTHRFAGGRTHRFVGVAAGALVASAMLLPTGTETAAANGDTRTIYFYHTHTGESIAATFRVNGHYDPAVLKQLNHFLRDWRNNDETTMDPRLFDTLWEVYRRAGATQPIQIYSAYRSPETNAMLRRRSRAVAEHSQHMLGKAMDTTIPGFDMYKVREVGMQLQRGGVGWYPSANFVHLDVGGVRSWPRMPYDELARLFPDGKTVHIASNGQVLPGYEAARQEIASRGGTDLPPSQESGGFFAWLFSGFGSTTSAAKEDEEDRSAPVARPVAVAAAEPAPRQEPQRQDPQRQEPQRQDTQRQDPRQAMAYAEPASPTEVRFNRDEPRQGAEAPRERAAATDAPDVVASLEQPAASPLVDASNGASSLADPSAATAVAAPLPPRRPSELLAAVAAADIPLPPSRASFLPVQTASASLGLRRGDALGSLIGSTASGLPTLRRSRLPAIITQGAGSRGHLPKEALAFAAGDPVASDAVPRFHLLPPAPKRGAQPAIGLRAAAAQGASGPARGGVTTGAMASLAPIEQAPVVGGAHFTGLRRAVRGDRPAPDRRADLPGAAAL